MNVTRTSLRASIGAGAAEATVTRRAVARAKIFIFGGGEMGFLVKVIWIL